MRRLPLIRQHAGGVRCPWSAAPGVPTLSRRPPTGLPELAGLAARRLSPRTPGPPERTPPGCEPPGEPAWPDRLPPNRPSCAQRPARAASRLRCALPSAACCWRAPAMRACRSWWPWELCWQTRASAAPPRASCWLSSMPGCTACWLPRPRRSSLGRVSACGCRPAAAALQLLPAACGRCPCRPPAHRQPAEPRRPALPPTHPPTHPPMCPPGDPQPHHIHPCARLATPPSPPPPPHPGLSPTPPPRAFQLLVASANRDLTPGVYHFLQEAHSHKENAAADGAGGDEERGEPPPRAAAAVAAGCSCRAGAGAHARTPAYPASHCSPPDAPLPIPLQVARGTSAAAPLRPPAVPSASLASSPTSSSRSRSSSDTSSSSRR